MDKLLGISLLLFFIADMLTLTSLLHPAWIVSRNAATPDSRMFGLISQCLTIWGRDTVCLEPALPPEWKWSRIFVITAIMCLSSTCVLIVLSHHERKALVYARWIAFIALMCMCLAAMVFPGGFYIEEIGGEPYRLPSSLRVGSSYILFFFAILLTIVSVLFAERICQPFMLTF